MNDKRDYVEFKKALEQRTLTFSASIINALAKLRYRETLKCVISQLSRAATSVGANYREANHSESRQDFIHKISVVIKEANETLFWLELLDVLDFLTSAEKKLFQAPHNEAKELYALFISIVRTARAKAKTPPNP